MAPESPQAWLCGVSPRAPRRHALHKGSFGDVAIVGGSRGMGGAAFLAARAAPSMQFWIALAGGIALARAAALRGLRAGYGASGAAMLQTVAVMGPARVNGPLTQALTAPLLGTLHRRPPARSNFMRPVHS